MMPDAEPAPFAYPDTPHVRIHGPRDYRRYKAYKPWLRGSGQAIRAHLVKQSGPTWVTST
jgi:hypothetical protein